MSAEHPTPSAAPDNTGERPAAGPDRRTLHIDYSKCIGCETCETVCKFLYALPRVVMVRTLDGQMVPLYCKHCENPHCMKVCPHNAVSVDEQGAVILSPMHCRGCTSKNCILGCPYGGIFATSEGVAVTKCDLCKGRRKNAELPACVEMCPCGAIQYIERENLVETEESKQARERVLNHVRPRKK